MLKIRHDLTKWRMRHEWLNNLLVFLWMFCLKHDLCISLIFHTLTPFLLCCQNYCSYPICNNSYPHTKPCHHSRCLFIPFTFMPSKFIEVAINSMFYLNDFVQVGVDFTLLVGLKKRDWKFWVDLLYFSFFLCHRRCNTRCNTPQIRFIEIFRFYADIAK